MQNIRKINEEGPVELKCFYFIDGGGGEHVGLRMQDAPLSNEITFLENVQFLLLLFRILNWNTSFTLNDESDALTFLTLSDEIISGEVSFLLEVILNGIQ